MGGCRSCGQRTSVARATQAARHYTNPARRRAVGRVPMPPSPTPEPPPPPPVEEVTKPEEPNEAT